MQDEVGFVLLCCRVFVKTADIKEVSVYMQAHVLDWERVYEVSVRHRVRPLVYRVLSGARAGSDRVNGMRAGTAAGDDGISGVSAGIIANDERVNGMHAGTATGDDRISGVSAGILANDDRVNGMHAGTAAGDDGISGVSAGIVANDEQVNGAVGKTAAGDDGISRVSAGIVANDEQVNGMHAGTAAGGDRISGVSAGIVANDERVNGERGETAAGDDGISEVSAGIVANDEQVNGMHAGTAAGDDILSRASTGIIANDERVNGAGGKTAAGDDGISEASAGTITDNDRISGASTGTIADADPLRAAYETGMQRFSGFCRAFSIFAFNRQVEMVRVAGLLRDGGVTVKLYKGMDFARVVYGDIGLREFTDMDVMIDIADVPKMIDIMMAAGYTSKRVEYFRKFPDRYITMLKDISFEKPCPAGGIFGFEFHYRPVKYFMHEAYSFEDLLGKGYLQKDISQDDYYSLMLLNHGCSDFFPDLRAVVDMVLLDGSRQPLPEGLQRFEWMWQAVAAQLLHYRVMPAELTTDRPLMRTIDVITKRLLRMDTGKAGYVRRLRLQMGFDQRFGRKADTFVKGLVYLMIPNGEDIKKGGSPLYSLYYFTRWFRLLKKYTRI